MIKTPCYECENRTVTCHSCCKKYNDWAQEKKDLEAKIRKENEGKWLKMDIIREHNERLRRKGY